MASGTIKGKFSGTGTGNAYPYLKWSTSENTAGNYSNVKVELWFHARSGWGPYNAIGDNFRIKIHGEEKTQKCTYDLRNRTDQKMMDYTVRVNHSSDGGGFCTIRGKGNSSTSLKTISLAGKITLPKIPRTATFTSSASANFGSNFNVNIKSPSSSFRYTVDITGLGSTIILQTKGAGGSQTFSIPNSYMSRLTNATSTTVNLWVYTFDGNTKIGNNKRTLKLTVPSNVNPSVSDLSATETNSAVKALSLASNNFVQGASQVKLAASGSGTYGSSIKTYEFNLTGSNRSGSGNNQTFVANDLDKSGTVTAKVTVKDSRGRSATQSISLTSLAYAIPKITTFTAKRNETTATTVNLTKAGSYNNLSGKNPATWKLEYKLASAAAFAASGISVTDGINSYTKTGIRADASYQFQLTLIDKIGNQASSTIPVKSTKVLFDLHKDLGVGIGKMHEHGNLDVGGEMYLDGKITSVYGKYADVGGALNLNNSDIVGVNAMWIGGYFPESGKVYDPANSDGEGLMFPHSDFEFTSDNSVPNSVGGHTQWDTFRIMDGIGYLNGTPVLMDTSKKLWSGATYLTDTTTITPSVPIRNCPNGWILIWSDNTPGVTGGNNFDWVHTVIHKYHVDIYNGGGYRAAIPYTANKDVPSKYVYVNPTTVKGHKNNSNDKESLDNIVLRAIVAF